MTSGSRATRDEIDAILGARHADPFALLGPHALDDGARMLRVFEPHATGLEAVAADGAVLGALACRDVGGFFEGRFATLPPRYRLRARGGSGTWIFDDVYAFGPVLGPLDDHLLVEGMHTQLHRRLGAHALVHEGVAGVHFAVWAPHAERVSVVGDMNGWDGRRHPMRKRVDSGLWEIFLPGVAAGTAYKYEIRAAGGVILPLKADPVGRASELRPSTASLVPDDAPVAWRDDAWLAARGRADARAAPMSIYEVHLGSWRRRPDGGFMSYDELAETLVPYVADLGFTHLELLPVSEHPLDASWGYQPIGLFAPTRRFGDPKGFARFVDAAHRAGLGVILDWVPAHFPVDAHGLARFDGTALYEHPDPRRGFHPDWNTAIYDFGRRETVTLLASNALYWLEAFHVDGLRVDAVASMLYLDYSRREGEWIANARGGNTSDEAVGFLRHVNGLIAAHHPGVLTIAEESTAWPGVSRTVREGGLGFDFKWNMGWMHDTLAYMATDPVHRRFHHDKLTFGLLYAFAENFVLPISHDEVVHGKGTLLGRMPGDAWQKFANLRAYLAFMWGHPGKKLLFMGQEFGQGVEWNFDAGLEWHLLGQPAHAGVRDLVKDLNRLHRSLPALHARDTQADGFRWIVVDDDRQSVLAWLRLDGGQGGEVAVICNFTPVPRHGYRIGLPRAGRWREILNTDAPAYGGSGLGNAGEVTAVAHPAHGYPASAEVLVPPLAVIYLEWDPA